MKRLLLFICILLFITWHGKANELERILSFHSDIVIDTTGRVEVTETITVYADGDDIRRGIVRSIPMYRKDNRNRKKKMDFTIISVQRDGIEEPYHTEIAGENKELFLGSSDVLLKPDIYTYTIVYEAYGHIGFFDEHDELYWNVTGNDWAFYIEKASATITLPEATSFLDAACYTGSYGESNNDCSFQEQNGKYTFQTNNRLKPSEGFTFAVAFTPYIIKRPPPPTPFQKAWEKYGQLAYSILALLILSCYYFFTWRKIGKDPDKQIVVPTFDPPYGWNAPTVRRSYKRKHDEKVLTVALIEMAIKGLIRINMEPKKYFFSPKRYVLEKQVAEGIEITEQEEDILTTLFPEEEKTVAVTNKNYERFAIADILSGELSSEFNQKETYRHNYGYATLGIFLTLTVLISYLCLFTTIELTFLVLLTFIFILTGFLMIVQSIFGTFGQTRVRLFIVGLLIAGIALFLQQTFFLIMEGDLSQNIFISLVETLLPIYYSLIKAPTTLGLQIDSRLKGFRMYLKTAEENRLNLLTPPDRTPELFERLLPYAIALDVENAWGKKFNHVLRQANYSPNWYQGSATLRATSLASSFAHSFGSSVRHARIDPTPPASSSSGSGSWSSGSSGGGYSGGGGGGGGGRGW